MVMYGIIRTVTKCKRSSFLHSNLFQLHRVNYWSSIYLNLISIIEFKHVLYLHYAFFKFLNGGTMIYETAASRKLL